MTEAGTAFVARDTVLGGILRSGQRACFRVWAPYAKTVEVHLFGPLGGQRGASGAAPSFMDSGTRTSCRAEEMLISLEPAGDGYFQSEVSGITAGTLYKYRIDGEGEFPDPASRSQPEGVHGPSEILDERFEWHDGGWRGIPLGDYIFYELHVGTFTREGTFDAAIRELDYLRDLGITAVELMPVAQFPGCRNWGYDGVFPFAVQNSYGGANSLKRFVDTAHSKGLAVVLDVVYNHLGPEGNYFWQFGPYFTDRYHTPWGNAVNYDGEGSRGVRSFVVENAVRWVSEFHIDALRLDAVHTIYDSSPRHILREVAESVHEAGTALGRKVYVTAESDSNESRLVRPTDAGGYGLDSQWSDDFHHSLHALLTGERSGYYQDFGSVLHLAKALEKGWVYSGQYSAFRGRHHGDDASDLVGDRFVVCAQNHDQIGNRMLGERLNQLVDFESLKVAAGALLLSPFLPLIFMGQEWADPAPFLYFVSHSDPDLIEAVRQGRRREFAAFSWHGEVPDPQAQETFERSRPDPALRSIGKHGVLLEFYRELIRIRKQTPAVQNKHHAIVLANDTSLSLWRSDGKQELLLIFHFGSEPARLSTPCNPGIWELALDSADSRWLGPGSGLPCSLTNSDGWLLLPMAPKSFCLLTKPAGIY